VAEKKERNIGGEVLALERGLLKRGFPKAEKKGGLVEKKGRGGP